MKAPRRGFTLVEVALAVTVGLIVTAGSIIAYQSMQVSAKFSKARSMAGTIQTNIGMEKFKLGSAPTLASVQSNTDSSGRPYWPDSSAGTFPADPVMGLNTVTAFDSTQTAVALTAGDPIEKHDNPYFLTAGTGVGGWLYDATSGSFRINLSNAAYPEHRPGSW